MRLLANAVRNTPAKQYALVPAPDRAFPAQLYRQSAHFSVQFILFCPISHSLYLLSCQLSAYINLTN